MKKKIIVINGKGGSGKDTLISNFPELYQNVSSIDPVKEIALFLGWDGEKDEKGRRFLAELKAAADHYSDYLNRYLMQAADAFLRSDKEYLFVHIRESSNIYNFKTAVLEKYPDICIKTVLVKAIWSVNPLGNKADDLVDNYPYDLIYFNQGNIEESSAKFHKAIKTATDKEENK